MKMKLLYDDFRIEVFDTNELTEKKALGDRNLLTNYELRMDQIDGDRLWLEMFWYDASASVKSDNPDGPMPTARRTNGWRLLRCIWIQSRSEARKSRRKRRRGAKAKPVGWVWMRHGLRKRAWA